MDDLDYFNAGKLNSNGDPLVSAFLHHHRDDGWEKVLFTRQEECGYCDQRVHTGWLEMECDAIRCGTCVPPERK